MSTLFYQYIFHYKSLDFKIILYQFICYYKSLTRCQHQSILYYKHLLDVNNDFMTFIFHYKSFTRWRLQYFLILFIFTKHTHSLFHRNNDIAGLCFFNILTTSQHSTKYINNNE